MRKLFDHRCEDCGVVDEHLVEYEDKIQTCPHCGGEARRILSPVKWLENEAGIDGSFPGAAMKWEKDTVRRHAEAGQAHQGSQAQRDGLRK